MYQAKKNITLTRKHILASPPKNKQTNKRTKKNPKQAKKKKD